MALRARALDDIAGTIEVHVGRGRERRLFAKVEKRLAPIGQLDGHEAPAAQVACGGVDHGHRITHGDRRIDCVATALEHIDAHLGGKLMRRDHHAMFAANGCD